MFLGISIAAYRYSTYIFMLVFKKNKKIIYFNYRLWEVLLESNIYCEAMFQHSFNAAVILCIRILYRMSHYELH